MSVPEAPREFRVAKKFRNIGMLCTAFAFVAGLSSTFAAYFNIDGSFPRPKLAALSFAILWSPFAALGIWLWCFYYKSKLIVDANGAEQFGMWRTRRIEWLAVHKLIWRRFPAGGSVCLKANGSILKIALGDFTAGDRDELIALLRRATPEEDQVAWDKFDAQFADSPAKQFRAKRMKIVIAIVFLVHIVIFGGLWLMTRELKYMLAACANGLGGGLLLWDSLRKKGEVR